MNWPDSSFLRMTGARLPVIQAPMAGFGGVDLAVAAIRAGAVGSLPCALLDAEAVAAQVGSVRDRAGGPLNLNFFCHTMPDPAPDETAWQALLEPYYLEYGVAPPTHSPRLRLPFDEAGCAVVEAVRPTMVSFHFGLPPAPLLARVKASGALVAASATSLAEGRWLVAHGADIVIAQGTEAGGHSGWFLGDGPSGVGLMTLLPALVDALDVPVVAAGGIMDGRAMAAAFALGAQAVQLGTALLLADEADTSVPHRQALASDAADGTRFTNLMSGRMARGIPNRLMRDLGDVRVEAPAFPYAAGALAPLRLAAEAMGRSDFTPLWAGQGARAARPGAAAEIITAIAADARSRL